MLLRAQNQVCKSRDQSQQVFFGALFFLASTARVNYKVSMDKKLQHWLVDKGWSKAELARQLGVTRAHISAIALGRTPGLGLAHRIELITDGEITVMDLVPHCSQCKWVK